MSDGARILVERLTPEQIVNLAAEIFDDMFKVVVDVERGVLAAGGALHADAEQLLLDDGSRQQDVWGANYFPARAIGSRLEYSALINIRPDAGNSDQNIRSEAVRAKVRCIVEKWIGPA
jgi:hypothetical protein